MSIVLILAISIRGGLPEPDEQYSQFELSQIFPSTQTEQNLG